MLFYRDDTSIINQIPVVGIIVKIPNSSKICIDDYKKETKEYIEYKYRGHEIGSIFNIHQFRNMHKMFGVNRKLQSSPERLLRMMFNDKMPIINPVVDLYNYVSVKHLLALGAHDISKLDGDVCLKQLDGTEVFQAAAAENPIKLCSNEYGYVDMGNNNVICRLDVQQCNKTLIADSTQEYLFIVQSAIGIDNAALTKATSELIDLLKSHFSANILQLFEFY